jgi:hypothetical protein
MYHAYKGAAWQFKSRFILALVMCAAVLPMLPLQNRPDPLGWVSNVGVHSAGLVFLLALTYAALCNVWLRAHLDTRPMIWFALGTLISLIPGAFYALLSPDVLTAKPLAQVLLGGVACGLVLGGPAFLMLRYYRIHGHVA